MVVPRRKREGGRRVEESALEWAAKKEKLKGGRIQCRERVPKMWYGFFVSIRYEHIICHLDHDGTKFFFFKKRTLIIIQKTLLFLPEFLRSTDEKK